MNKKEMVGWLKEKIKQDLEKYSDWVQPRPPEIEKRIGIYQSILAALDGPSEEERKEMLDELEFLVGCTVKLGRRNIKMATIKRIRALIASNPAPEKEKE